MRSAQLALGLEGHVYVWVGHKTQDVGRGKKKLTAVFLNLVAMAGRTAGNCCVRVWGVWSSSRDEREGRKRRGFV